MPRGILTTLRAGSLINDGTALVLFAVTVGVVGGAVILIRKHVDDPLREGGVSILTPFVAFLLAELVHASGVLAVVVAGLLLSYAGPRVIGARSRLTAYGFWDLSTFMINGSFVLLGMQVPRSLRAPATRRPRRWASRPTRRR